MSRMKLIAVLCIVAAMFIIPAVAAAAELGQEPITGIVDVDEALAASGLGVLIMLGVEIAKRVGVVPDGWSGKVAMIAGVALYLLLLILNVFDVDLAQPGPQTIIEILRQIMQLALAVLTSMGSYGLLRNGEVLTPIPGRE